MTNSKAIAGLVGPTLIAIGAANLVNVANLPVLIEQGSREPALIYIAGILMLVAGLAILRAHSQWRGWPIMITALGWLSLIGGLLRMFFPIQLGQLAGGLAQNTVVPVTASVLLLAIGTFLSFKGYTARSKGVPDSEVCDQGRLRCSLDLGTDSHNAMV